MAVEQAWRALVRGDGCHLGHPVPAYQGRGQRGVGARARLDEGHGRGPHPGAGGLGAGRLATRGARAAAPLLAVGPGLRGHRDHRAVGAAVHRGTPAVQLDERPADRLCARDRGAARLVLRPRAAEQGPGRRARARVRGRGAARRPQRRARRLAGRRRGAAHRGLLRRGTDDRQPQAGWRAEHRGQRDLPGHRRRRLHACGGAHLAARGSVRAGARLAGSARRGVHGGRTGRLLHAHRGGRRGPRHGRHVPQPRGGGRTRRRSPRRAATPAIGVAFALILAGSVLATRGPARIGAPADERSRTQPTAPAPET